MKNHISAGRLSVPAMLVFAALAVFTATLPAWALDVAGVNYRPVTTVEGVSLRLNGAGVRQFASSPLYTAGLYLEQKSSTTQGVLQAKGAKQVRVVMLRETTGKEMGDLLAQGLIGNSSDEDLANLIPEIMELGTLIAERGSLRQGDSFQIDWTATSGTTITVIQHGSRKPVIEVFAKPELIGAMMRMWIGEHPADPALKAALLGQGA